MVCDMKGLGFIMVSVMKRFVVLVMMELIVIIFCNLMEESFVFKFLICFFVVEFFINGVCVWFLDFISLVNCFLSFILVFKFCLIMIMFMVMKKMYYMFLLNVEMYVVLILMLGLSMFILDSYVKWLKN